MKKRAFEAPDDGNRRRLVTRAARIASHAALASGALLVMACASERPPAKGGDGGAGGASASTTTAASASTTSASGSGGAPACNPAKPTVIPDGWVAWTDWSCDCPFWIPGDATLMPPPLQWKPCEGQPVAGIECQQIAMDWAYEPLDPIGVSPRFGRSMTGEPFILLTRQMSGPDDPYVEQLVVGLDGSIVFSMRQKGEWDHGCTPFPDDLNEGRFAFHVRGDGSTDDAFDSNADGLIYGEIGDRVPRVGPCLLYTSDAADE